MTRDGATPPWVGIGIWVWVGGSVITAVGWAISGAVDKHAEADARFKAAIAADDAYRSERRVVKVCRDGSTIFRYRDTYQVHDAQGWNRGRLADGTNLDGACQ